MRLRIRNSFYSCSCHFLHVYMFKLLPVFCPGDLATEHFSDLPFHLLFSVVQSREKEGWDLSLCYESVWVLPQYPGDFLWEGCKSDEWDLFKWIPLDLRFCFIVSCECRNGIWCLGVDLSHFTVHLVLLLTAFSAGSSCCTVESMLALSRVKVEQMIHRVFLSASLWRCAR